MAIDSAAKRCAVAGVTFPLTVAITPDATQGLAWRQNVGWGYLGVLTEIPPEGDDGTVSHATRRRRLMGRKGGGSWSPRRRRR